MGHLAQPDLASSSTDWRDTTMNLEESLAKLNDQQLEAVEHLNGPLLVVAGPGTGKTQLLSLRAANILAKRDAAPGNILCLTYADAGLQGTAKCLADAVWARIQEGSWGMSVFEQNEQYETAAAEQANFKKKAGRARVMQGAYEK